MAEAGGCVRKQVKSPWGVQGVGGRYEWGTCSGECGGKQKGETDSHRGREAGGS